MRPNNQNRRGRGRGPRKPHSGGPHGHGGGGGAPSKAHSFDSSGPDIRVRGNAYQVLEKYLQLARDADRLAVSVTDTGVGFDPALLAQPGPKERFGLISVRERIGFVNGTLAIKAIPGNGTVVTLTVPLTKPGAPVPE